MNCGAALCWEHWAGGGNMSVRGTTPQGNYEIANPSLFLFVEEGDGGNTHRHGGNGEFHTDSNPSSGTYFEETASDVSLEISNYTVDAYLKHYFPPTIHQIQSKQTFQKCKPFEHESKD